MAVSSRNAFRKCRLGQGTEVAEVGRRLTLHIGVNICLSYGVGIRSITEYLLVPSTYVLRMAVTQFAPGETSQALTLVVVAELNLRDSLGRAHSVSPATSAGGMVL